MSEGIFYCPGKHKINKFVFWNNESCEFDYYCTVCDINFTFEQLIIEAKK